MLKSPAPAYIEAALSCFLTAAEWDRSCLFFNLHAVQPFSLLALIIVRGFSLPTSEKKRVTVTQMESFCLG